VTQIRAGFQVKYTSYPYFIGGRWDRGIFSKYGLVQPGQMGVRRRLVRFRRIDP
jgi:hypothetical protein